MYEENNAHKIDKVEVILHSVDLSKEGEELTCKQHKWFLCTDYKEHVLSNLPWLFSL